MQAGSIISFQLPEWTTRRYGQVLRRNLERMTVKMLRTHEVLELYNWAFSACPGRQANPDAIRMEWKPPGAGGSHMPLKTVIATDGIRTSAPDWKKRLFAWLRSGKYKRRTYWVEDIWRRDNLARCSRRQEYFYELCFRIKGYCCADGDFIPVCGNSLMTPLHLEQYNFLRQKKPSLWNSIQSIPSNMS